MKGDSSYSVCVFFIIIFISSFIGIKYFNEFIYSFWSFKEDLFENLQQTKKKISNQKPNKNSR